nr:MAG TPA: hypothetical protein [Caudoviricetes sp.]
MVLGYHFLLFLFHNLKYYDCYYYIYNAKV